MMEEEEKDGTEEMGGQRDDIYSKSVRAGKRTYFFDVKATRGNDYYMTITESKKRFNKNGTFFYEKHKIFLYKEDFEKFNEALAEIIEFINSSNLEMASANHQSDDSENEPETKSKDYSNLDFDDLEKE